LFILIFGYFKLRPPLRRKLRHRFKYHGLILLVEAAGDGGVIAQEF
jgi:hypothetical protein